MTAWCFFDFAAQAFATVVQTFIFATYFTNRLASDPARGSELWGITTAVAGFVIAASAPFLGAVADRRKRRKPWIAGFLLLCVASTALLATVRPTPEDIPKALILIALGIVGVQGATVFYNAMLPDLAERSRLGAWSGRAWALGYVGGILALALVFLFFGDEERAVWTLGGEAGHVRVIFPFVALWLFLFSLPLFLMTPESGTPPSEPMGTSVRKGLGMLRDTGRDLLQQPVILKFLIARALYIDGLATVFAMGGVYAAGTFGFTEKEMLLFGIALNLTAGAGAAAFSFIDDRIGSRRVILLSLGGLIVTLTAALLAPNAAGFWASGICLGFFVGPVQASSRSFLARLAPPHQRTQLFGFYSFSAKATAFAGPLLVGLATGWLGNQRLGMGVVLLFFIGGYLLFRTLPTDTDAPVEATETRNTKV